MLQKLRAQSRSFIIWLLFAIIIVSFIVTFGPSSMQLTCGQATTAGSVAEVRVSNEDVRFVLTLGMQGNRTPGDKARLLDELVKRTLLAEEARKMGLAVSEEEIKDMITLQGDFYFLGQKTKLAYVGGWPVVVNAAGKKVPAKHFFEKQFNNWVKFQLRMTPRNFFEQQRKELLADKASAAMLSGVIVSEAEAKKIFEYKFHSMDLQFAKLSVDAFLKHTWVTYKQVKAHLDDKKHLAEVDERYKKRSWRFKGLAHERRVRHILFRLAKDAAPAEKLRKKRDIEALRKTLESDVTAFPKLASERSEHEETQENGGDLGWNKKDKLPFGAKFQEAVFAAKIVEPGTLTPVVETDEGLHLILVEGDRKGTLTKEQARRWIAEEMLREGKAKAMAKEVAEKALAMLLKENKKMEEVFPPKNPEDGGDDKKKAAPAPPWHPLLPEVQRATVRRIDDKVAELGKVKGLMRDLWRLTEKKPVLDHVVSVRGVGANLGSFVVFRLEALTKPDLKEFAKQKDDLIRDLRARKGDDFVRRWVYSQCESLRKKGKITFRKDVQTIRISSTTGGSDPKKDKIVPYIPCQRLLRFGPQPFEF